MIAHYCNLGYWLLVLGGACNYVPPLHLIAIHDVKVSSQQRYTSLQYYVDDLEILHLPKIFTDLNITKSNSEARRLITAGSFTIDGQKHNQLDIEISLISGKTLKLGKRNYFTIIIK